MVLVKNPKARIMMDLQKEWAKVVINSESYPQASLVIRGSLIKKYPEYTRMFIGIYSTSLKNLTNEPQKAGMVSATFLDSPSAKIITRALPRGNLKWANAQQTKKPLEEYLLVLKEFSTESIGGKLPDENFFFQK
jgi:NitT/TauT family transport system substrate-binding protein